MKKKTLSKRKIPLCCEQKEKELGGVFFGVATPVLFLSVMFFFTVHGILFSLHLLQRKGFVEDTKNKQTKG